MRIRRNPSRLLAAAAVAPAPAPAPSSDPPQFELPPPPPPPTAPADESPDDLAASDSDEKPSPGCVFSQSPWDLMATLDLSDPEAAELFQDTYFISPIKEEEKKAAEMADEVTHKAVEMADAVGSIKEEEKKAAEMVHEVTHMAAKTTTEGKKNESGPMNMEITVKKQVWACKRNDGKGWFCRRPASKPNSYCLYHYNKKPPSSKKGSKKPHMNMPVIDLGEGGSKKPHRKKPVYDVGEEFCYYAGFVPSRGTKRKCRSSALQRPPLPAEQQKEAAPSVMHCHFSAGQADDMIHQVAPASARVKVPARLNDNTANIASCKKVSGDDDVHGWNGEQYLSITKRNIPFKKGCRKPVKARSLKSLIYPVVE